MKASTKEKRSSNRIDDDSAREFVVASAVSKAARPGKGSANGENDAADACLYVSYNANQTLF